MLRRNCRVAARAMVSPHRSRNSPWWQPAPMRARFLGPVLVAGAKGRRAGWRRRPTPSEPTAREASSAGGARRRLAESARSPPTPRVPLGQPKRRLRSWSVRSRKINPVLDEAIGVLGQPSFSSQSTICCIAATNGPLRGLTERRPQKFTLRKTAKARLINNAASLGSTTAAIGPSCESGMSKPLVLPDGHLSDLVHLSGAKDEAVARSGRHRS